MKAADIFPSKWLAAADLGDKEPNVVIDRVLLEDVSQTDRKPVLYFRGKQKGMVCNKTNWKRIEYILKSDDSDDWSGKTIKLYVELVDMQGQMKPALRVKAPDRQSTQTTDRVSGGVKFVERDPIEEVTGAPTNNHTDQEIPF